MGPIVWDISHQINNRISALTSDVTPEIKHLNRLYLLYPTQVIFIKMIPIGIQVDLVKQTETIIRREVLFLSQGNIQIRITITNCQISIIGKLNSQDLDLLIQELPIRVRAETWSQYSQNLRMQLNEQNWLQSRWRVWKIHGRAMAYLAKTEVPAEVKAIEAANMRICHLNLRKRSSQIRWVDTKYKL